MGILLCAKADKPNFRIDVGMTEILKLLKFSVDLLGGVSITIDAQCGASVNNPFTIVGRCFIIVGIFHLSIFALAKTVQRECATVPSSAIIGFTIVNVYKPILFLAEA